MTRKKVDAAHPSPENPGEEPSGPDVMGDYLDGGWQVDEAGRWKKLEGRIRALRARVDRLSASPGTKRGAELDDVRAGIDRLLGKVSRAS